MSLILYWTSYAFCPTLLWIKHSVLQIVSYYVRNVLVAHKKLGEVIDNFKVLTLIRAQAIEMLTFQLS